MARLEDNLREMDRAREAYWLRHASTSPLTTAPEATCAPDPIVDPGRTMAPTPMSAPASIRTAANTRSEWRMGRSS